MAEIGKKYHAEFSDPSADIVLRSSNGTLFRIHSFILKMASPIFRDMFAVSQDAGEPVSLSEDEGTIRGLLIAISPDKGMPDLSFPLVVQIVLAAKKYRMKAPVAQVRAAIIAVPILAEDPLAVYTLACRHGWVAEATLASTHTLSLNILDPALIGSMHGLSSEDLLKLLRLHRSRRDKFQLGLDEWYNDRWKKKHHSLCFTAYQSWQWKALKAYLVDEMDKRPSGLNLSGGRFLTRPEAEVCWNYSCSSSCGHKHFDKADVQEGVNSLLAGLPITI